MFTPLELLLENELATDAVSGDVTAQLLGEKAHQPSRAVISTRSAGVFSGKSVCDAYQKVMAPELRIECLVSEGQVISAGTELVHLSGPAGKILSAERTLLNFTSHLCGIATLTKQFVEIAQPYDVRVLATRKTLPGLRPWQLHAVEAGGGFTHRRSLADGILIKDNHLKFASAQALVEKAKKIKSPLHRIEIEVQSLKELEAALSCRPDVVMLDNFAVPDIKEAVSRIKALCDIEVSGGMTLERVKEIAPLGVHYISIGALTHSSPALNLTLDILD